MARIPLTKGRFAIVDDRDYFYLSLFAWQLDYSPGKEVAYARRNHYKDADEFRSKKSCSYAMHREILGITDPTVIIDHIDHDGLNNQRTNLRICTQSENTRNSRKKRHYSGQECTSKYKGVHKKRYKTPYKKENGEEGFWISDHDSYLSYIRIGNKTKHLGLFRTEVEAATAYNEAALKYHGEFAEINDIKTK